jgi:hypothetical protein
VAADRTYGAVFANLGVTLRWPLVTAESGGSVIVPVVDGLELPIEGALEPARGEGPRRVVVLIDASAARTRRPAFATSRGPARPCLRAPRADHPVDRRRRLAGLA